MQQCLIMSFQMFVALMKVLHKIIRISKCLVAEEI